MPKIVRFWCWSLKRVDPNSVRSMPERESSVVFGVQWSYRSSASHDEPFSYGYRGVAQIEYPFARDVGGRRQRLIVGIEVVEPGIHELVLVGHVAHDALTLAVAHVVIVVVDEMRAKASEHRLTARKRPQRPAELEALLVVGLRPADSSRRCRRRNARRRSCYAKL